MGDPALRYGTIVFNMSPQQRQLAHLEAQAEHMLDRAAAVGVDLLEVETVRRRLTATERECWTTPPSERRSELEGVIQADIAWLCEVFVKLQAEMGTPRLR